MKDVIKGYNRLLSKSKEELQENGLIGHNELQLPEKAENAVETEMNERKVIPNKRKKVLPMWKLTRSEIKLLCMLIVKGSQPISRNKLAIQMFGDCEFPSNMTRLSTIIKNLRGELVIENEDEELSATRWGQGYQLTKAFFDYYEIDDRVIEDNNNGLLTGKYAKAR